MIIAAEQVEALKAVKRNIAAEHAMADQHEREAVKLQQELDNNLSRLGEKAHRELLDKIAAADRAAKRTRARAEAMRSEHETARRAELDARRPLLEAAVAERAQTCGQSYKSLATAIIALLSETKSIDDAVEAFNLDAAGIAAIDTIERAARKNGGPSPRPLYFAVELPDFEGIGTIRVPGTHAHSF